MTNKQPIQKNKLAGKETSLKLVWRQKSESRPVQVSKKIEYIRSHVEHFVLCLRDAYGFKDPMEVINKVSTRLFKLFPNIPIEKLFKWFYGNSLGWCTGITDDVVRLEAVDNLGLNSSEYYDSCKVFGGRLSKFLQHFFRRQIRHTSANSEWKRRKQAFSKAQTFLMFKKGSPQVSKDLIKDADLKHRAAMSDKIKGVSNLGKLDHVEIVNPDPEVYEWTYNGGWGDFESDFEKEINDIQLQENICSQVDILINKLFKKDSFYRSTLKKEQTLFPSTSGHSEKFSGRNDGGAANILRRYFEPQRGELDKMTYHPRTGVKTHYAVFYPNAVKEIVPDLLSDNFVANPVYLQEPLKVRTITRGPSLPYWFFKPIQRFLWKSLVRHPIFKLIGTPITPEILNEMLPYANKDGSWLSGDYSAATDNLVQWLSEYIWKSICTRCNISEQVFQIGLKGLTSHTLSYKDESFKQQNGQLMGSPLSFPILCIANAAICLLAFEKRRRNLYKSALRVNGDDCVMCYTEEERSRWIKYASFIGMSPSPGKCYYAKDWLQMNSELFILHRGAFKHINFTNYSLASPYLAKGGTERTVESLSQTMQTFCFGKSQKTVDVWLRRMGPFLKYKVPHTISWFLPQQLGGLGLISRDMSGSLFTAAQLRVANLFYNNALLGKRLPYKISSIRGGKAEYQLLELESSTYREPIFDQDVKPVKSYWSERFFKSKSEEDKVVPLLWENLVNSEDSSLNAILDRSLLSPKPVLNNRILKIFHKTANKISEPLSLQTLLRFRGYQFHVPKEALESNYEPKRIFLDILASLNSNEEEEEQFVQNTFAYNREAQKNFKFSKRYIERESPIVNVNYSSEKLIALLNPVSEHHALRESFYNN